MDSLPLRTRTAVAFGVGFFVLGAVLLALVAWFVADASGPAATAVAERVSSDLGAAGPQAAAVQLVGPDGRSLPATRLFEVVGAVADDTRLDVGRRLALTLPALAAVAALAGWLLARRLVEPLQAMTAVARRVSSDRLDARIGHVGPRDEVAELAEAVDRMMERLEQGFEAQGSFAAAVSHELRTPLAIIRTELDVGLAAGPTPEEIAESVAAIGDAVDRAESTIDALLALARSSIVDPVDVVDLHCVLTTVVAELPRTLDRHVDVTVEAGGPLWVRGDAVLLRRLVHNLVDNAVRHNVDAGWVHVSLEARAATAALLVSNSGPVLDDDTVGRLGEAFYRGESGRRGVPGTGLGLRVARAVVEGHGGSFDLVGRPGGGLTVTATLPLASGRPTSS